MIGQDGVQHRRNHMGEVVYGVQHEPVGFVVEAQRGRAHHLADEQVVGVSGKIVDEVESEQVGRISADFFQAGLIDLAGHRGAGGEIIPAEDEGGIQEGLDYQGVVFESGEGHQDARDAGNEAGKQDAKGYFPEFLLFEEQCVGHHVQGVQQQLHRKEQAHGYKFFPAIEAGHREGQGGKGGHQDQSQPQGEGENAADILPAQFLVLDDAGAQAHVGEQTEKGGEYGCDGNDAVVVRNQDAGQDSVEQHPEQQGGISRRGVDIGRLFDGRSGHGQSFSTFRKTFIERMLSRSFISSLRAGVRKALSVATSSRCSTRREGS